MFIDRIAARPAAARSGESGQAAVALVLCFACLSLGAVGFAVDFSNLWFHRQATQSAADAACQAGALDMLETSGGAQLNSMGFTPGTAGGCEASPGATMCVYAGFNGYAGAGPNPAGNTNSAWNTVSWSFPSSVSGVTAPPSTVTATPYLQVTVTENVQTWFLPLFTGSGYQQVSSACTCGLSQVKEAAPLLVLSPSASGALDYTGGASLNIVGGPGRSVQVNSTSLTALLCSGSSVVNTSKAGSAEDGADLGVAAAETQTEDGCGNNGGYEGFNGGAVGAWRSGVLPVSDPYSSVASPASMKSVAPITGVSGQWVSYHQDGCPDSRTSHYPASHQCIEFAPGYYPNGITTLDGYSTAIFLPGVYYMNGPLNAGSGELLRNATPCTPSCGPAASAAGLVSHQTDGVMFYFFSGSFDVSGCSGCSASGVDNVNSTALTCDGSAPSASLNMPSAIGGNVLWAQCAANATYRDSGGDTTDSVGSPGARGIFFFQDHANVTAPIFSGSGSLAFAGSLYVHSTDYQDTLTLSGAGASGTFIVGNIVADKLTLSGSGEINLALSPAPSTEMLKASILQ